MHFIWVKKFGVFSIGGNSVALNPEGMAMLVGMIMMLVFAAQVKEKATAMKL